MSPRKCWASALAAGLALLVGCATAVDEAPELEVALAQGAPASALPVRSCSPPASHAFYVLAEDPLHPRIRYDDGQVSTNDSCMIRLGSKLNRKMPPAYVNGMPLGFC